MQNEEEEEQQQEEEEVGEEEKRQTEPGRLQKKNSWSIIYGPDNSRGLSLGPISPPVIGAALTSDAAAALGEEKIQGLGTVNRAERGISVRSASVSAPGAAHHTAF